jgi:plasmid maintenance system antidote protein VapI
LKSSKAREKRITPEMSIALAAAFGTAPDFWLNLESAYRLWLAGDADPNIARRAKRATAAA